MADHVIEIPPRSELLLPDSRDRAAATAGVSHRRAPRLRCGSAAQPGQERDGRVASEAGHASTAGRPRAARAVRNHAARSRDGWREQRHRAPGLLTVFVQHTSASLDDSGERRSRTWSRDLNDFFERLVPEDDQLVPAHRGRPGRHAGAHPRRADADAAVDSGAPAEAGAGDVAGHLFVRAPRRAQPAKRRAAFVGRGLMRGRCGGLRLEPLKTSGRRIP